MGASFSRLRHRKKTPSTRQQGHLESGSILSAQSPQTTWPLLHCTMFPSIGSQQTTQVSASWTALSALSWRTALVTSTTSSSALVTPVFARLGGGGRLMVVRVKNGMSSVGLGLSSVCLGGGGEIGKWRPIFSAATKRSRPGRGGGGGT